MKRRLVNLAIVVSLVLCVATIAGWVRSRWVGDQIAFTWYRQNNGMTTEIEFGFAHGGGDFGFLRVEVTPPVNTSRWIYFRSPVTPLHDQVSGRALTVLGYGWYSEKFSSSTPPYTMNGIVLPYWLFMGVSAILPAWWWLGSRRRRAAKRLVQGLCPACGYDLRATPERCPECGAVPEKLATSPV